MLAVYVLFISRPKNMVLLQSLLGLARVIEAQGDLHDALRTINELHVKHSWFAPALMEKARLSLAVHGWQEAMATVSQLQQVDTNNVIAYTFHGTFSRPRVCLAHETATHLLGPSCPTYTMCCLQKNRGEANALAV